MNFGCTCEVVKGALTRLGEGKVNITYHLIGLFLVSNLIRKYTVCLITLERIVILPFRFGAVQYYVSFFLFYNPLHPPRHCNTSTQPGGIMLKKQNLSFHSSLPYINWICYFQEMNTSVSKKFYSFTRHRYLKFR